MEHLHAAPSAAAAESDFARTPVPMSARGPSYPIFLIVSGSLCGLPVFLLASDLGGKLGLLGAALAFVLGGLISGLLGALSAYAGSMTGMNLSLLAERTFGSVGSMALKVIISLCLMGWFTVICSVMGATASAILQQALAISMHPLLISGAIIVLVGFVTVRGVDGLKWVGIVILPLTAVLLSYALAFSFPMSLEPKDLAIPSANASFSAAVTAVVGIYIVGIVIQPDFGRFSRVPARAAMASGSALAVFYPCVLLVSAIPAIALHAPDLLGALVGLGVAVPALALLLTGALIDSALSLYSGVLGIANLQRSLNFRMIVILACVCALGLAAMEVHQYFVGFLTLLGVALPPVAAINIFDALSGRSEAIAGRDTAVPLIRTEPCVAWALGAAGGYAASKDWISLSTIASLDSVLVTAAALLLIRVLGRGRRLGATSA